MDLGPLRDLSLALNLAHHGVPATVTVPGGDPVETRVLWETWDTEAVPGGQRFRRAAPMQVAVLSRDAVPEIPRGTRIVAPERLGQSELVVWRVDGTARIEADHTRVTVVREPEDA